MSNIDPTTPEGRAKLRELLDTDLTLPLSVLDDGELVGIVDADDHMADRDIDAELAVAAVNALPQLLDALDAKDRQIDVLCDALEISKQNTAEKSSAIERVRAVHREADYCAGTNFASCNEDGMPWPCPTIKALDGER